MARFRRYKMLVVLLAVVLFLPAPAAQAMGPVECSVMAGPSCMSSCPMMAQDLAAGHSHGAQAMACCSHNTDKPQSEAAPVNEKKTGPVFEITAVRWNTGNSLSSASFAGTAVVSDAGKNASSDSPLYERLCDLRL